MADPMVTTAWLAERLGRPRLSVLDSTWLLPPTQRDARAEFLGGHIPGARFFDIDEIADHTSGLPHMLPAPAHFEAAARALGVGQSDCIVVYDTDGLFSAPRAWWSFRAMGAPDVFVLDGGLPRWKAEERSLEVGSPPRSTGDFEARFRPELVRDLKAMRALMAADAIQILDARPPARFSGEAGEPRPGLRKGHIPGSRNLPWSSVVSENGALKSASALSALFTAAKVDLAAPIVTTCGSGVSAAALVLALARLGHGNAAIYDGSWAEWGARIDTPVETGAPGP